MSKQPDSYYFKRKVLLHQTGLQAAEAIIGSQKMLPGSKGMYGPGVYFGNSIGSCDLKALNKGVYLVAEVEPRKTKPISKEEANQLNMYNDLSVSQKLMAQGFTAVCGYHQPTGREFVLYDPSLIISVKYCYGTRPTTPFPKEYGKDLLTAVLFWVTSKNNAQQIGSSQRMCKYNGPFGLGYYLFDSITDAIQELGQQETFLAADMDVSKLCTLRPGQTLHSHSLPHSCTSFVGTANGIKYFMVKDPKYITSIHFCGGQPWNASKKKP